MDNLAQQIEELEVLISIFEDQWKKCESVEETYTIKLKNDVEFWITLNELYPSDKPPQYELRAPSLTRYERDFIDKELNEIYETNKGFPIIYQWIEKLKDIIEGKITTNSEKQGAFEPEALINQQVELEKSQTSDQIVSKTGFALNIVHGPTITDRRSTFQGHVCNVTKASQINEFMEELCTIRKIREATHNILAYRIVTDKNIVLQDCEDDGETHAGGRLLHLLEMLDVKNVAVVISRWYGGIHLGPDRFKHINNAGRQVLVEAGLIK